MSSIWGLVQNDIPEDYIEKYPPTICPIDDFEIAIQIMKNVGIEKFMSLKINKEHLSWDLNTFMYKFYKDEKIKYSEIRKDSVIPVSFKRVIQIIA